MVSRFLGILSLMICLCFSISGIALAGPGPGGPGGGQWPGGPGPGDPPRAFELDPAILASGVAILVGGVLLLNERRRKNR